jgi:hypothetical protein
VVPCDPNDEAVRSVAEALARRRCDLVAVVTGLSAADGEGPGCDVRVDDGTGALTCRFFGRRSLPGVVLGRALHLAGRVVATRSGLVLLNPRYELVDDGSATSS